MDVNAVLTRIERLLALPDVDVDGDPARTLDRLRLTDRVAVRVLQVRRGRGFTTLRQRHAGAQSQHQGPENDEQKGSSLSQDLLLSVPDDSSCASSHEVRRTFYPAVRKAKGARGTARNIGETCRASVGLASPP